MLTVYYNRKTALQRQPLQLPFERKSEMNELQTDIRNSPDAPQLITKSLNSLKLLKINIQIGGALLVELVRVSLINRLERVASSRALSTCEQRARRFIGSTSTFAC